MASRRSSPLTRAIAPPIRQPLPLSAPALVSRSNVPDVIRKPNLRGVPVVHRDMGHGLADVPPRRRVKRSPAPTR
jgi:hypothetical protein